jgi:glycosyltransferase involved in cell wall biosynthesis
MLQNAAPFCRTINPRAEGLLRWLEFAALGRGMILSARSAARVIFISETFRKQFGCLVPPSIRDSRLIYLGREIAGPEGESTATLSKLHVQSPYILCVSHLYPYKNLSALIMAYAAESSRLQARGLRLYIVGKVTFTSEYKRLEDAVQRFGLREWIVFTGPVSQSDAAGLFPHAEFVVFQSTCENCPSTLIEAMAAGTPIACSNASSIPEIGGDAVVYFDPFQPADIARAMVRLAEDPELRARLRNHAKLRASQFPSWSDVARLTMETLESVAVEASPFRRSVCVE